jgi:hypothetical protein
MVKYIEDQIKIIDDKILPILKLTGIDDYKTKIFANKITKDMVKETNKILDDIKKVFPVKDFNLHKTDGVIRDENHLFNFLKTCFTIAVIPFELKNDHKYGKYLRLISQNNFLTEHVYRKQMSEIRGKTIKSQWLPSTIELDVKVLDENVPSISIVTNDGKKLVGKEAGEYMEKYFKNDYNYCKNNTGKPDINIMLNGNDNNEKQITKEINKSNSNEFKLIDLPNLDVHSKKTITYINNDNINDYIKSKDTIKIKFGLCDTDMLNIESRLIIDFDISTIGMHRYNYTDLFFNIIPPLNIDIYKYIDGKISFDIGGDKIFRFNKINKDMNLLKDISIILGETLVWSNISINIEIYSTTPLLIDLLKLSHFELTFETVKLNIPTTSNDFFEIKYGNFNNSLRFTSGMAGLALIYDLECENIHKQSLYKSICVNDKNTLLKIYFKNFNDYMSIYIGFNNDIIKNKKLHIDNISYNINKCDEKTYINSLISENIDKTLWYSQTKTNNITFTLWSIKNKFNEKYKNENNCKYEITGIIVDISSDDINLLKTLVPSDFTVEII